jgi:hypothetical protein
MMKQLVLTTLPMPCHMNSATPRIALSAGQPYSIGAVSIVSILTVSLGPMLMTAFAWGLKEPIDSLVLEESSDWETRSVSKEALSDDAISSTTDFFSRTDAETETLMMLSW